MSSTSLKHAIGSTEQAPKLFLQRLALFSSFSPGAKFQEVEFKRGLNLIVGEDSPSEQGEDNLGGHSVGKTTLCRLIRYCLGEPSFSTSQDQEIIRENIPDGWVGCEVLIEGTSWAVLLPFSRNPSGRVAARDESLESLFTLEKQDNEFREYQIALDTLMPKNVNRSDVSFEWRHLLAWLSRDQDCIQRSFWDWRSSGSESGSPQHRSRRAEGEHLLRSVLGLLADGENQIKENLANIEAALKVADELKSNAELLPTFQLNTALKQLQRHFDIPAPVPGAPLPTLTSMTFFKELEKDIKSAEEQYNASQSKIARLETVAAYWHREAENWKALLDPQKDTAESMQISEESSSDPVSAYLNDLIARDKKCPTGIDFAQCDRVQAILEARAKIKRGIDLAQLMTQKEHQKLLAEIAHLEGKFTEAQKNAQSFKDQANKAKDDRDTQYKELIKLSRQFDLLTSQWEILEESHLILAGTTVNEPLSAALREKTAIEEKKLNLEMQLSLASRQNQEKVSTISNQFNALVGKIIGGKCTGKFMVGDECKFSIQGHKGVVGGEAIKVLRTILGDIACMLASPDTDGTHPGLLIHDSPRQADMSRVWYERLLNEAAAITEAEGGQDNAGFQYIVTTTTTPPDALEPYVRKRFASIPPEKLLFRKRLKPLQAELFD